MHSTLLTFSTKMVTDDDRISIERNVGIPGTWLYMMYNMKMEEDMFALSTPRPFKRNMWSYWLKVMHFVLLFLSQVEIYVYVSGNMRIEDFK